MLHNQDQMQEFADRLSRASLEELVGFFNREAGKTHWVGARGRYLAALRSEFMRRDIDCSAFIDDSSMCLRDPIRLNGDRTRLVPSTKVE